MTFFWPLRIPIFSHMPPTIVRTLSLGLSFFLTTNQCWFLAPLLIGSANASPMAQSQIPFLASHTPSSTSGLYAVAGYPSDVYSGFWAFCNGSSLHPLSPPPFCPLVTSFCSKSVSHFSCPVTFGFPSLSVACPLHDLLHAEHYPHQPVCR